MKKTCLVVRKWCFLQHPTTRQKMLPTLLITHTAFSMNGRRYTSCIQINNEGVIRMSDLGLWIRRCSMVGSPCPPILWQFRTLMRVSFQQCNSRLGVVDSAGEQWCVRETWIVSKAFIGHWSVKLWYGFILQPVDFGIWNGPRHSDCNFKVISCISNC